MPRTKNWDGLILDEKRAKEYCFLYGPGNNQVHHGMSRNFSGSTIHYADKEQTGSHFPQLLNSSSSLSTNLKNEAGIYSINFAGVLRQTGLVKMSKWGKSPLKKVSRWKGHSSGSRRGTLGAGWQSPEDPNKDKILKDNPGQKTGEKFSAFKGESPGIK